MTLRVDVLISMSNGIIEEVSVLSTEEAKKIWNRWGHKHGYANYQQFLDAVDEGEVEEELRWFGDFDISEIAKKEFNPSLREKIR